MRNVYLQRRDLSEFLVGLKQMVLEGVDWINQAQDRDRWRALVNTVIMNLRGP
jgi:hypothetical protein